MPAAMGNRDPERLSDIKCILRSLLISNGKLDVTLPRLNGMFREEEGENIPFREFDYPSLQEFLRSMPDVVHLRYNREHQLCAYHVDTEESAHISSLVSRQKNPQKKAAKFNVSYKPRGNSHGNYYSNYSRPPAKSSTMSTANSLRLVLDELRKAPKYFQNHNGIRKSDILQRIKERPGRSSINSLQTLNAKLKDFQYLVLDADYVYFKEDVFTSNSNASSNSMQKSTKYAFQNLQVRSAPSQPTPPPPQFTQAKSPAPSQTSQMSVTKQQANQIPKAMFTDVEQAQKSTKVNCDNEVINDRIKFRLQKLMERYPEGIWAADLPSTYLKEFNIDLNYRELGFNSITEFASAVPEIVTITDPEDTGRHMILDAKIPLNKSKQQTKSLASHYNFHDFIADDKDPVPNKLSPTVCQKFIPEGMMGFDETVEIISVGSLAHEDYFEVNISEIFTPSFFWITLRKNKSKIKKLMDDLDQFYKLQDLDACRLPQVLIETGLNVACIYAKMWHRAIIKKVKPDGYAVVLFYDYGTVKTYNPNDLYYLHKRFSALPAQAVACGLYNVKAPQSNEWPISSTNLFVKKVWGVPLIATVCETNENNNTMMITLTDTNDSFDLHINDWMIAKGYAVHGKMENIPSNKYHVVTYGVPLDKLSMYDEDILRKREQEYEKSLEMKGQDGTSYVEYPETEQAEIKDADVFPNYNADSSCDTSSIFTLVQENINLTKQTNTITQAILSNMPVNTQIDNINLGAPTPVKINTSEYESYPASDSCFDDMKKTWSDLNRNLNTIKNNFTEIISDSRADLLKSGSGYLDQNDRNYNPESSAVSLNSVSSSFDYAQSTQYYSNKLANNRASSNQSLCSQQSTLGYQNQVNEEFDKFSVLDGTPTYYNVKHNDNLPKKSQIPNKSATTFANTMIDQSKINNNLNANYARESDEGYQTTRPASSTQTSNVSSNTSLQSRPVPFAPIELSERCSRKIINIFHLDNEGWIPVNEFIDCFTNLKLERVMFKLLDTFNISVDYKHLTRTEDPQLFSQLDKSQIKAPRECKEKIKSDFVLILMPIRTMLHVLDKLEFVDGKVFKEASSLIKQQKQNAADVIFERFNNKILYDVLNLLIQYRQFKRLHTTC